MTDDLRHLRAAVADLERAAALMRRRLHQAEDARQVARRAAHRVQGARDAGRAALALERDGIEATTAAQRIAQARALPLASVVYWQDHYRQARTAEARAARNRQVLRLAGLGWTNAQVARACGISTRTVTRIIASSFRS